MEALFPHVACYTESSCIRTWPCRVWYVRYTWIESMHRWPILTVYRRHKLTRNAKRGRPHRRLGDQKNLQRLSAMCAAPTTCLGKAEIMNYEAS